MIEVLKTCCGISNNICMKFYSSHFQMRVRATDSGGLSSTANVVVNINRNLNQPTWLQTSYTATIDENFSFLTTILTFQARDVDSQAPHNTLSYLISSNNLAQNYFDVVGNNLFLRNSLIGSNVDQFQVIIKRYLHDADMIVHKLPPICTLNIIKGGNLGFE